jgi:hypothetical protein
MNRIRLEALEGLNARRTPVHPRRDCRIAAVKLSGDHLRTVTQAPPREAFTTRCTVVTRQTPGPLIVAVHGINPRLILTAIWTSGTLVTPSLFKSPGGRSQRCRKFDTAARCRNNVPGIHGGVLAMGV